MLANLAFNPAILSRNCLFLSYSSCILDNNLSSFYYSLPFSSLYSSIFFFICLFCFINSFLASIACFTWTSSAFTSLSKCYSVWSFLSLIYWLLLFFMSYDAFSLFLDPLLLAENSAPSLLLVGKCWEGILNSVYCSYLGEIRLIEVRGVFWRFGPFSG